MSSIAGTPPPLIACGFRVARFLGGIECKSRNVRLSNDRVSLDRLGQAGSDDEAPVAWVQGLGPEAQDPREARCERDDDGSVIIV